MLITLRAERVELANQNVRIGGGGVVKRHVLASLQLIP